MKKNDILTVDIIDNGVNFEGIAKYEGMIIFVPGSIIGENIDIRIIKVTSSYAIAKIETINTKSKNRIDETICSVFKTCGGCESQHIEYDFQLNIKDIIVKNTLNRQGVEYSKLNSTIGMGLPYYYRNKVQYPVRNVNGINKIGFYSKRTHNIVENNCCYIQNRVIDMLAKIVFEKLISYDFSGYNEEDFSGDIRHIILKRGYHTAEIMIIIVVCNKKLLKDIRFQKFVTELAKEHIKGIFLNVNDSKTNEILGDETICIYGEKYITDTIGDYLFYISPKSFFQVNTVQTEMLYNVLKEELNLKKDDILFDLYSGVGTIGIFLSEDVKKVYGIEMEEEAVEMANKNILENDIKNCEYIAGCVEDKIEIYKKEDIKPTVIVVDPPRKGLDEKSIQYILDFNPDKIGYVSCNPATLTRDLKILSSKYIITSITPVDMFPHTVHVECVVILKVR
ncbi:MAG: 23S rRNA (uracil(1939)-C(5))-methyltransferase RlmD [Clostridia bacterium]|nr:23S rRNA (uracil(1939)-C(5))-methyltransferase RlmD [Clostridia bacterium]MDD4387429.1 23S rRNA (uracil(1939)-C(5))-methyltransferase RlmD [Clostridia bacterium]